MIYVLKRKNIYMRLNFNGFSYFYKTKREKKEKEKYLMKLEKCGKRKGEGEDPLVKWQRMKTMKK